MAAYEQGGASGNMLVAFLCGAAIGAVAGLLLAPESGRDMRERLQDYARRGSEKAKELAERAGETSQRVMERGREFAQEQVATVREAADAGRNTMRQERERMSGRESKGTTP